MDSSIYLSVSNLNFLRGLNFANQEDLRSRPDIQEHVKQVANSLLQPTPGISLDQIKTLPKLVQLSVVKCAIDNALDQDNHMVLQNLKRYVNQDIMGNLLGEPTERYAEMIEEYYTKVHAISLHGTLSQNEIENRLLKLSPAVKSSITKLDLSDCLYLNNLSFLDQFPQITDLNLSYTSSLRTLRGIQNLHALSTLNIDSCRVLPNLDDLKGNNSLTVLLARECSYLSDTNGITNCLSLKELDLSQCNQLKDIRSIHTLVNLKKLKLKGIANLKTTNICKKLFNLEELHLEYSGVTDIADASALPKLRTEAIYIEGCRIKQENKDTMSTSTTD